MGLQHFGVSNCSCDGSCASKNDDKPLNKVWSLLSRFCAPNPDPRKFTISYTMTRPPFIAVMAVYEGCTNFEGQKVMVFKATLEEIERQGMLDPHFCDGDHISPIARFRPDDEGWRHAVSFVEALAQQRLSRRRAE